MKTLIAFLKDESGPTAVEYAVMLGLILVTALAAIGSLGVEIASLFNGADSEMRKHFAN